MLWQVIYADSNIKQVSVPYDINNLNNIWIISIILNETTLT